MADRIRLAAGRDSEPLLRIYAPYIETTSVTFETEVPSIPAFASRIEGIAAQYPYLVYETGGEIGAYAYASRHRERAAYLYDVEVSVYAAPACHGKGAARRLYGCLFELLAAQGYYNAYAGYVEPNPQSARFHEKFGFTPIGTFHRAGYKFGKWHDLTWAERAILPPVDNPLPVKSVHELPGEFLQDVLNRHCAE